MYKGLERRVHTLEANHGSGLLAVVWMEDGESAAGLQERVEAAQRKLAPGGIVVVWDL